MCLEDFKPLELMALAQLLKRLTHTDYMEHAKDDNEVYQMSIAVVKLQKELAELGYNPR